MRCVSLRCGLPGRARHPLRGEELPAGSLVLTGAAAGAEPLSPGQVVELEVTGLAPVCLWAV